MVSSGVLQVYLIAAVCGWGLVAFFLAGRSVALAPIAAALGLTAIPVVGGWLVLSNLMSPSIPVIFSVVGVGCFVLGLAFLRGNHVALWASDMEFRRHCRLLLTIIAVVALARILSIGFTQASFNGHDDFQGYLMFSQRLLVEGHLVDPFDGRRLIAGMMSKSFLDAIALRHLGVVNLFFAERVLGHVLLLLSLLFWLRSELSKVKRLGRFETTALAATLVFMMLSVLEARFQANTSATTTATALLFAMFVLLDGMARGDRPGTGQFVALGLIVGAVCSFKSNLVPGVAFTLPLAALLAGAGPLRGGAGDSSGSSASGGGVGRLGTWFFGWAVAAGTAGLVVLPWMIELHNSSGTWLYPVLGRGNFSLSTTLSSPGALFGSYDAVLRTLLRMPLVFGVVAVFVAHRLISVPESAKFRMPMVVAIAMVGQTLAIGAGTGGEGMVRYGFPFFLAAVLFLFGRCLVDSRESVWTWATSSFLARPLAHRTFWPVAVCAGLAGATVAMPRGNWLWKPASSEIVKRGFDAAERARYEKMASNLPADARVLAYVELPYLLNFARNRFFTPYLPCWAFPDAAYNCARPPADLVRMLAERDIHFLMYSYQSGASFSHEDGMKTLETNSHLPTHVAFARGSMDFNEILRYVVNHTPRLYDDGRDALVDLRRFVDPGTFSFGSDGRGDVGDKRK